MSNEGSKRGAIIDGRFVPVGSYTSGVRKSPDGDRIRFEGTVTRVTFRSDSGADTGFRQVPTVIHFDNGQSVPLAEGNVVLIDPI